MAATHRCNKHIHKN